MITAAEKLERKELRFMFLIDNYDLFEKAFIEYLIGDYSNHKHKEEKSDYSIFIEKARVYFGYSKNANAIDIWCGFDFEDVKLDIIQRYGTEKIIKNAKLNKTAKYSPRIENPAEPVPK